MAKRTTTVPARKRVCNLVRSKSTERDWRFEDAVKTESLGAVSAPPPTKDLRAAWWKVGDQGETGSCVGWATAEGVMRYHLVQAGRLGKKEMLSPRFTWMASKETDEFTTRPETFIEGSGTSLKAAMDVCRKLGAVTDKVLPFHIKTLMYGGDENQFWAGAAQRRASAYFNLKKNVDNWRTWIASNGPILAGIDVDAEFDTAAQRGGLLDTFKPRTVRGGHAICIVGYRKDGRFIIRNSWGTAWGDKGFAYASEAYIQAAFYDESYGVTL